MPTYQQYQYYAAKQGFQPLSKPAFESLIRACFNPISNQFVRR